jgi:hypothetical protein
VTHLLKVDVDTVRGRLPRRELEQRARIVHVQIVRVIDTRSPSGRGWHRRIVVTRLGVQGRGRSLESSVAGARSRQVTSSGALSPGPEKFSPRETVFLQLLFGSDPIREAFNWHRARLIAAGQVARFWAERWNTLYSTSGGR